LQIQSDSFSIDEHDASVQNLAFCAVVLLNTAHRGQRQHKPTLSWRLDIMPFSEMP
jgi:hypothetical protein